MYRIDRWRGANIVGMSLFCHDETLSPQFIKKSHIYQKKQGYYQSEYNNTEKRSNCVFKNLSSIEIDLVILK